MFKIEVQSIPLSVLNQITVYNKLSKTTISILLIVVVLILDQWLKIHIKTSYTYGAGFDILGFSWAKIHFVENEGMAFGFAFGGYYGKLFLSLFRVVMVVIMVFLIRSLIIQQESISLIISFALIIAGALGNIIDGAFYGLLFSETTYTEVATFLPESGGYADFLQGKVVDMFYFPLFIITVPEWIPGLGGSRYQFFQHVFNIADASISIGVVSFLIFHRQFFKNIGKN